MTKNDREEDNAMDAMKNTVPEGQSSTAQEVHVVSQGVEVYVDFRVEGIDRVNALIQEQKDLIARIEWNIREINDVMVRLNARISKTPDTYQE